MAMTLPDNHPLRVLLNDEVHARPPPALKAPCRISFLALVSEPKGRKTERAHLGTLCDRYGAAHPDPGANHFTLKIAPDAAGPTVTLLWERHTEFARYMVVRDDADGEAFSRQALDALPPDWVAAIPGKLIVSTEIAVLAGDGRPLDTDGIADRYFDGNVLVGAAVSEQAGAALADFRIRADGSSRVMVWNRAMTPRQTGRTVQRLLEIDSYRMMALMALPIARGLSPFLSQCERELSEITARMTDAPVEEEPQLLQRLTRLEAEIQSRHADNHFRFSAAAAYHDIVERRIAELRESRLPGVQAFGEFTERRLVPAVNTSKSVALQLESLSERVARATQSLSTRTAITRERQNQALLETMARRAKMQLRLQQTVEGLSVAAVSYYVVGLIGYGAKGLKALGSPLEPDLIMAISIPLVVAFLIYGLQRIRARLKLGSGS